MMSRRCQLYGFRAATAVLALVCLAGACASTLDLQPVPNRIRNPQTQAWVRQVTARGGDGDWLVARGYGAEDDAIVRRTRQPFSRVAVLCVSSRSVFVVDDGLVKKQPLREFLHDSHHVRLVRPRWWTPELGRSAVVEVARRQGRRYETAGLPSARLALDAWHGLARGATTPTELGRVDEEIPAGEVWPAQALLLSRLLYDTGARR